MSRPALWILVLFWSLLVDSPARALDSVSFEYEEIESGRVAMIDVSGAVFSNQDIEKEIYICPESSGYHCMLGGLPFAIPRYLQPLSPPDKWSIRGYEFHHAGIEKREVLGIALSLHRIEFSDPGGTVWYLYSPERGLVFFGVRSNGVTSTYALRSACGFAADSNCHAEQKQRGE